MIPRRFLAAAAAAVSLAGCATTSRTACDQVEPENQMSCLIEERNSERTDDQRELSDLIADRT